ncbi:hypothetical protein BIW11_08114 [Tropilaelaps mercedesae]|uniref:C2H2-type domain-containing protein n=1 Tax=Tropilaelaps mercedesae TaxID=418985 RepID=A0A1V9XR05_9ACAR|nr:hypothetical protein BIW11_08114 [Tropilaelaps mercedesae]
MNFVRARNLNQPPDVCTHDADDLLLSTDLYSDLSRLIEQNNNNSATSIGGSCGKFSQADGQLQVEVPLTGCTLQTFGRPFRHENDPQKIFPEDEFIVRDADERFRCTFCEHKTSSRSRCREHVRTHTGVKPYQCELCGRCFNKRECRDNHVRSRHTLEKPYNCNLCPKSYSSSAALAVHRKTCRMRHGLVPDNA